MLYDYKLQIESGSVLAFDTFGIIGGTATLTAGGEGDKMTLIYESPDGARSNSIPAKFARVKLYYQPDPEVEVVLVWQGVRMNASWKASASPGSPLAHRINVEFVGLNYFLGSQTFLQVWKIQNDPSTPVVGNTRDTLTSEAIVAGPIGSLASMIEQAVEQITGVSISTDTDLLPDFTPASEQIKDVTCLEVVNRMQSYMPGFQSRWNQATSTLEWHSILKPDNRLGLPASDLTPRTMHLTDMADWSGTERNDLLIKTYIIDYLRRKLVVDEVAGIFREVIEHHQDSATTSNGSRTTRASVIPLSGLSFNGVDVIDGESIPANGLAKLLLAPFADPYYDLNFKVEIDWSWLPLILINVDDAAEGFDDAWAHVTSVSHDLVNDYTTITAGPPAGVNRLRQITRPIRTRRESPDNGEQQYGFGPGKPRDGGGVGDTKKVLTTEGFFEMKVPTGAVAVEPFMAGSNAEIVVFDSGTPTFNPANEETRTILTDVGLIEISIRQSEDPGTPDPTPEPSGTADQVLMWHAEGGPSFEDVGDCPE